MAKVSKTTLKRNKNLSELGKLSSNLKGGLPEGGTVKTSTVDSLLSKKRYNEGGRQSKNVVDLNEPKEFTKQILEVNSMMSDRHRDKTPISKQYKNGSKPGKSIFTRKMQDGSNDDLLRGNYRQAAGKNGDDAALAGPGPGSPPSKFEGKTAKPQKKALYSFFKHTIKEK